MIAFARQSFLDAQWQKEARAFAERRKDAAVEGSSRCSTPRPALERRVLVAFDASEEREILRALAFAKEFNLDPIIVGGAEAANVIEDLKAANARVIVSTNFQAVGGVAGDAAARVGEEEERSIRRFESSACARTPRRFLPPWRRQAFRYAFTIGGLQNPADFVRNVARTVREEAWPRTRPSRR